MPSLRMFVSLAFVVAILLRAIPAAAEPQNGWWWNPGEDGRGFFIEMRGGSFYVGGYLYEIDGSPTWTTAGGEVTDPYKLHGTLHAYRGGQSLFGAFRPPATPAPIGAFTLDFSDDTHATLTWPGGTVALERFVFGSGTPAFQPYTGWWWNETESGRGFSVEVQGGTLFVSGFMYDDTGAPAWYLSAGPMATATTYEGDWLRFAGGQAMGGPYRRPGPPTAVGRVRIDFTGAEEATFTFTEPGTAAAATRIGPHAPRVITLPTQRPIFPRPNIANPDWPFWDGKFTRTLTTYLGPYSSDLSWTFDLEFKKDTTSSGSGWYNLAPGSTVRVLFTANLPGGCTQLGGPLTMQMGEDHGALLVSPDLTYEIRVTTVDLAPDMPFATYCPAAPPVPSPQPLPIQMAEGINGSIRNHYAYPGAFGQTRPYTPEMRGRMTTWPVPGRAVLWLDWLFEAR